MKTTGLLILSGVAAAALTASVISQSPQPAPTPFQQLQTMKERNLKLIEQQTATLQKLEEMQLQAQQIKFLGKRS